MRIDPQIAALRGDRALQQRMLEEMSAKRAGWLERPEVAAVLADFRRFSSGQELSQLCALGDLMHSQSSALAFVQQWCRDITESLRDWPLAQIPARHSRGGGYSMMQIMADAGASLAMSVYERSDAYTASRSAVFSDRCQYEIVIGGHGSGSCFRISGERESKAFIQRETCKWRKGSRIVAEGPSAARHIEHVPDRLVILQLGRIPERPGLTREFALPSGELLMQSSGDKRSSQNEMAMAVLSAMERTDAVEAIAALAGEGPDHCRWEAIRHTLALDPTRGFRLLSVIAESKSDPLAAPASQLVRQLRQTYPQLATLDESP